MCFFISKTVEQLLYPDKNIVLEIELLQISDTLYYFVLCHSSYLSSSAFISL